MNDLKIVTGTGNKKLAECIAQYNQVPLVGATVERFPDGETRVQIEENVRGSDLFIVQPTCPPANDNLMELLLLLDAAKRSSARRITAVIPYYGYGRQERVVPGSVPVLAPNHQFVNSGRLVRMTCAPLLGEAVRRINAEASMSGLF
jgi:ribose-phosphate pyrophosphokinase